MAVSLESFARYHATEAWTWERMALTRARVICGGAKLSKDIESVIATALAAERPAKTILTDAAEMRDKLAAQFPGKSRWDLKFAPGGLVDIEFIAQTLQLTHPGRDVVDANTVGALQKLAAQGAIGAADRRRLFPRRAWRMR